MVGRKLGWAAVAVCASIAAACGSDDGGDDDSGRVVAGSGGANMAGMNGAAGGGTGGSAGMAQAGKGGAGGTSAMTGTGGADSSMAGSGGMAMAGSGGTGSGGSSSSGTGMSPSPTDPPDISTCTPPPASATEAAKIAFEAVNSLRLKTGAGCAVMVEALNQSSTAHCDYYAANSADDMCTADPHGEVMSCMKFTGTGPGQRMKAAGYTGNGGSEVMAFANDPQAAVDMWINSVWHRIPLLDPWTAEFGYGAADGCDVIDLGRGMGAADTAVTVYPYDGQIDVPTSFDGSREGPMPPAPPTGWPSGSPINVYAKMLKVTEHTVTKDGDPTPLEHVWLTAAESNFLRSGAMIYSNAPFEAMTKYRVRVVGTAQGGPIDLEWTFTTGMASRWGRP